MSEKPNGVLGWIFHYDRTVVFWFGVLLAVFGWYFRGQAAQEVVIKNSEKLVEHEKRIVQLEQFSAVQNEVNKNLVRYLERRNGR